MKPVDAVAAAENAKNAAIVLAKVLTNVEKGMPLDVAYDLVFGFGAFLALASDIHAAANAKPVDGAAA